VRIIPALIAAFLSLAPAFAAEPTADPGPAIWQISDEDTTIYLMGTIHVLSPDIRWQSPAVERVIAQSDVLVLESLADSEAESAFARNLTRTTPDKALSDRIRPENRAILADLAKEADIPLRRLDRMPVWLASFMLVYGNSKADGISRSYGVETRLAEIFKSAGKPLDALEDSNTVVARLNGIAQAEQIATLDAWLDQKRNGKLAAGEIAPEADVDKAWAQGDLGPLEQALSPDALGPAFYAILVVERNRAWADGVIARLAHPGTLLIAVGAAHLTGPDSLLRMLEARGVSVRRIS